ncbi:hypothetical protein O181_008924 [Austropuccinia psidii MF-1]|uniref:Uncharacterized protein n=1 Tax=Austropuccinia psidii MF-1 TaxID=1389203 RepID=A0A9Q3GJB9_9BASI|nr:hypothetical protein [Austropuccinia psidii MF-1]
MPLTSTFVCARTMLYTIIKWTTVSIRSSRFLCGFVDISLSALPPSIPICVANCFDLIKQEARYSTAPHSSPRGSVKFDFSATYGLGSITSYETKLMDSNIQFAQRCLTQLAE